MEKGSVTRLLHAIMYGGLLVACTGSGIQDAEKQAREGQATAAQGRPAGSSIWSLFGSSGEAVRKRLDPGLGKAKAEQITVFGQPFGCNQLPTGGEICGWYDAEMSEGGLSEANQHRVFYTYNQSGIALEWTYQGMYGKYSSVEAKLPTPPAGSSAQ